MAPLHSNNVFCSLISNQNQNETKSSTFSNWRVPGQPSQTNYAQKEQFKINYNFNLNDPDVKHAAGQIDAVVSDTRGDAQDQDQADGCPIM